MDLRLITLCARKTPISCTLMSCDWERGRVWARSILGEGLGQMVRYGVAIACASQTGGQTSWVKSQHT